MFSIPTVTVAKTTLTGTASSVTLTYAAPVGVAWTPRHLLVRVNATNGTAADDVQLQFNGDTGSNYNRQYLLGNGTSEVAGRDNSTTFINIMTYTDGTTSVFGGGEILIPDALSTRSHKSAISMAGAAGSYELTCVGRWASTAAITSVTLTANTQTFAVGSSFELCVVDESFNIDQDGDGEQIKTGDGTFTVSSIAAADGDLVVIGNLRGAVSNDLEFLKVDFNGDSTATNYQSQYLQGSSTAISAGGSSVNNIGLVTSDTAAASAFGAFLAQVTNFSDGSNDRVSTSLSGGHADSGASQVRLYSYRWNNTAAVTSVKVYGGTSANFITGSMLSTYAVPKNLIERIEVTGDSEGSKTFADISQGYDHLELSIYARTNRSNTVDDMFVYFNGDTTDANYFSQRLTGNSTTVNAAQYTNAPWITTIAAANATANEFSAGSITIHNYTKTDRHKHHTSALGTPVRTGFNSNRWASTAAITSITLDPVSGSNFLTGTVLELRGISADITPAAAGYTIFF